MTNAAKWKEFLRWWAENRELLLWLKYSTQDTVVSRVERKIEELQKGDNDKK